MKVTVETDQGVVCFDVTIEVSAFAAREAIDLWSTGPRSWQA